MGSRASGRRRRALPDMRGEGLEPAPAVGDDDPGVDAKNSPSKGKTAAGVSATCTRCGFILTVSAHTVGILKRIDQP